MHSCSHCLKPRPPPPPPIWAMSYTRALMVSQDRRHLFEPPDLPYYDRDKSTMKINWDLRCKDQKDESQYTRILIPPGFPSPNFLSRPLPSRLLTAMCFHNMGLYRQSLAQQVARQKMALVIVRYKNIHRYQWFIYS